MCVPVDGLREERVRGGCFEGGGAFEYRALVTGNAPTRSMEGAGASPAAVDQASDRGSMRRPAPYRLSPWAIDKAELQRLAGSQGRSDGRCEGPCEGFCEWFERVVSHLLRVVSAQKDSRNEGPEAVERLYDQLQTSLRELVTSEDWQRTLAVAARFHDYSFANSRLIWAHSVSRGFQPSRVAGYRMWQQLGCQVRRSEHGLQILAPVIRRITPENGNEGEWRVVGFRVVRVFDIAQTDGEPLPEVTAVLVEGDLPSQWERVGELITGAGFGLQVADLDRLGDANGITDWQQRDVVVRASLPCAQPLTRQPCQRDVSNAIRNPPTSESCRPHRQAR